MQVVYPGYHVSAVLVARAVVRLAHVPVGVEHLTPVVPLPLALLLLVVGADPEVAVTQS